EDLGSDIGRFEEAGMAVRVDHSPFHMHHKFALVDFEILLTGSYNWTRGAARDNAENLIVTTEARLVSSFMAHFDRIWKSLA
ncbi:phospholipase D-like domain-containing protein, partial [Singulisphaera rosea]